MTIKTINQSFSCLKLYSVGVFISFSCFTIGSFAQPIEPDASIEAENGVFSGGVTIEKSIVGYSGTGYVTNFKAKTDKVTVTMKVASMGFYKLMIRYNSDDKTQDLFINGNGPSSVVFPKTTSFTEVEAGKYLLNIGDNTFTIQSNWGWINIDKFSLYSVPKNTYTITPNLINSNADSATKSLYNYLISNFNVKIISGQTNDWYEKIKPIAGKTPLLRAFDFQHYSQGYPYLWDNATQKHTFGIQDDGQVQKAIDWYNQTGKKGIVNWHWHWHSPGGGKAGTNTFYTEYTTFDVSKAVVSGNVEYTKIIEDIDTIAYQLKKLQSAGVPILWRPLHEAGGAWFWWGAKGPDACKKLYQIMYDRLTNYHKLNNLIWVWSTPENDWYPGNNLVDIIGHDSYPGVNIYDPQKSAFDRLFKLTNGEKIIAMTENGPIPNPDDCFTADAPWSYFMSWSDLVTAQNTNQHIIDVFNNKSVLTLENPTYSESILNNKRYKYRIFPNPATENVQIEGRDFTRLEIIDMNGRVVYSTINNINVINTQFLENGIYILKIWDNQAAYPYKLIIKN